ncbi:hypothetical protein ZPAH1_orf00005 [Aeromonas phage ZPAH1]|nr:hypothetical protein ASwh1_369 [Aeromonas phage Aswh_1]QQG33767.1 hypothetical protein ZPAH1_orf00005 [Aeromonas phage ZPAH1]
MKVKFKSVEDAKLFSGLHPKFDILANAMGDGWFDVIEAPYGFIANVAGLSFFVIDEESLKHFDIIK